MRIPTTFRLSSNAFRNNHYPSSSSSSFIHPPNPVHQLFESRIISLLNACTHLTHLRAAHARIYRCGLDQSSYVLTKLIRIFTKFNSPMAGYPRAIFSQVCHPNSFLWTALIRGYVVNGPISEALVLYDCMRENGALPTSFTFCALFKAATLMGDVGLGCQLHGQMFKYGGFSSELFLNAGNTLIDLYVKCGVLECAHKVFDEMPVRDVVSGTSLIVAYAKGGAMEAAMQLFDELDVKDAVVWTAMITSYSQNARPKDALDMFDRMQCCGIEADEFTLAGVISACAQLGTTNYLTRIRDIAERSGYGPDGNVVIGSALVDMYAKCGRVDGAYEIFKVMKERNVYTYSSMILGFAVHGRAAEAIQLFYEMDKTDIRPNKITLIGVLTACSHAGMVNEGRQLFRSMEEKYGVIPTGDHYTCMVDLLGRSGHLEEALALAKSMPLDPHGGVWGALLGACRIHNNPDIAQVAASHLFELEPNNIGNYVLLANILSSAGRWDSVTRVRTLMKIKGLKKIPARSWVEGQKGSIQEFFAGDLTHPRSRDIMQVLEDLLTRLKLLGYQPNLNSVSYDISDDDKRQILMTHSEKLALAYELLTTESAHTIRIMKNLRICEDCHIFMCGASKITGREIVVRDNMRFHHFRDGSCSCGNFW
ncbi:pentatricopeptide repeat-containing protein At5g44230-like [Chenopodium quinoa]|nr:pentatricopeptide repeat-containing protein At5g44230-like [Chenopodium quinoa]XP_021714579.1 pentatricopeptide repeat-containing protein At5g44230-like [Chenopodium quinoa]XP_021714580.1 pentatricopeptide repeat-containing protein At5g44230-like [Chenopodium quinoa]XP_021714581.1 pentatricopeptide repeat-containing protein At5g44230-like [Chenopodium quinoa]